MVWINDHQIINSFLVYPNPALNELIVEINDFLSSIELSIINLSGQALLKTNLTDKKTTMELNNPPNGISFIKYVDDRNVEVKKIIIE